MLLAIQKITVRSDGYFLQQQYSGYSKLITSLHTVFKLVEHKKFGKVLISGEYHTSTYYSSLYKTVWLCLALHLYRAFQTQVMNDCVQLSDSGRVAVPFVLVPLNYRKANQFEK